LSDPRGQDLLTASPDVLAEPAEGDELVAVLTRNLDAVGGAAALVSDWIADECGGRAVVRDLAGAEALVGEVLAGLEAQQRI